MAKIVLNNGKINPTSKDIEEYLDSLTGKPLPKKRIIVNPETHYIEDVELIDPEERITLTKKKLKK